ncbi:MAG: phospholipid-binding protein MlaC [Moraxellaceae bacterium]
MKVWQRLLASLVLMLPFLAQANTPAVAPQQMVENATRALLDRVLKEKAELQRDPEALFRLVDENITPFVDVDGIARGVMGQYFRQATPAQQQEFARVFKQSLVRTYARGLTAYDNQRIVFKPYRAGTDATRAQVEMEVHASGQVYPVTFQLQTDKAGQWKVRNLIINGINLGLTFRNQFASAVEANRGNIGRAIAGWSPDTRALEDKPAQAAK